MYGIPYAIPWDGKVPVQVYTWYIPVQRHREGPDANGATHTQNADRGRAKKTQIGTDPVTPTPARTEARSPEARTHPGRTTEKQPAGSPGGTTQHSTHGPAVFEIYRYYTVMAVFLINFEWYWYVVWKVVWHIFDFLGRYSL